jgi:HAMP domain-containing protein/HPt (histidine-containing phosphotransfer) domain-containing protein/two-component sensor histidine kinase
MPHWNFGIARKLLAVCLAFGLPIVVMFVLMTRGKLAEIEFASQEIKGNAFQRPLEDVLQHVSQHRRLWAQSQRGDVSSLPRLRAEELAISDALARLDAADRAYGRDLQFTEAGLGLRNRNEFTAAGLRKKWEAYNGGLATKSVGDAQAGFRTIILHIRTMITHAGDISNLILDPDLDSYYLMDVTLLALPQMEERIQEIELKVDGAKSGQRWGQEERVALGALAAFLQNADWDRVAASTNTAINEDQNFHGVSPTLEPAMAPHVKKGALFTTRVVADLRALSVSESATGSETAGLRSNLEALDDAIYAFHRDALDEQDRLLRKRISDFEKSLYLGFLLAAAALLISVLLAWALGANIVRRVRRISATTKAFSSGNMGARVGNAGADELGELAQSFDEMTDRIGGLAAEVRLRADELQKINGNLEAMVDERTRQLQGRNDAFRLILDNAHDGMLTVDRTGAVPMERSATIDRWFGTPEPGATLAEYIGAGNPALAASLALGLEEIWADVLPLELNIEQLPRRMELGKTHFRLEYQPILEDGKVSRLLVILSDVTSEIESRRAAALQEETLRIFQSCQRDRAGFLDFFADAREIVAKVCTPEGRSVAEVGRLLHTLKGNCALFGVLSMSGLCHDIENQVAENCGVLSANDEARLGHAWDELSNTVAQIVGERASNKIEVDDEDYASIVDSIGRGAPRHEILAAIARWKLEPTQHRLGRFAERAKSMARRLGKDVDVVIEPNDMRLCAETWSPVWNVLAHVLRNAIDHGIEPCDERARQGKAPVGRIRLRTLASNGRVAVEISDDGAGVAWEAVAVKARIKNLPCATRADLIEAIFADGLSTKSTVTDVSGRGVGMSSVREVCRGLGGQVEIESELGTGTTVRCSFPDRAMAAQPLIVGATRKIKQSFAPPAILA